MGCKLLIKKLLSFDVILDKLGKNSVILCDRVKNKRLICYPQDVKFGQWTSKGGKKVKKAGISKLFLTVPYPIIYYQYPR